MNENTSSNIFSSKLGRKLLTAVGAMLLLAIITILGVQLILSAQAADAELVNVSGRQRMLSQRMAKEALQVFNSNRENTELIENLEFTLEQYNRSWDALRNGNPTGDAEYGIPVLPAGSPEIQAKLDEISPLFAPLYSTGTLLSSGEVGPDTYRIMNRNFEENNLDILRLSNDAVTIFETEANLNTTRMQIFVVTVGILNAIVFIYVFNLVRKILQQTDNLAETVGEILKGDTDARADVITDDELGDLASGFNTMADNTLTLIQSQEEKEAIQGAIIKLLDEVSMVADGDLTAEAEVSADITGAIADSFNFMIAELRDIILNVQEATLQVSASANQIQTTAEHLATGSEAQAERILNTSAAIDEMSVSIQQVSENASLSATVGEQARANARKGSEAVDNTIAGMERIREQVQESSKRMKRLGESSQEVGEIVQLISDIADRTSILALNASIQAAMAGEAGRGFAVVAEEVERLAERSNEATRQIEILIRTIQNEVNEAVGAMESTTSEVVAGSELAYEAGSALDEIETVSDRLAELIQSISLAAQQQARGSETIAQAMNDIADVTQQTAAGTKEATVSIGNLAELADELRGSVSQFKIEENRNGYHN